MGQGVGGITPFGVLRRHSIGLAVVGVRAWGGFLIAIDNGPVLVYNASLLARRLLYVL